MGTRRTKWWTLVWPDGTLDIDAFDNLHLEPSRRAAKREADNFDPMPLICQVDIRLVGKPESVEPKKKPSCFGDIHGWDPESKRCRECKFEPKCAESVAKSVKEE